jgi:hypothetical protein
MALLQGDLATAREALLQALQAPPAPAAPLPYSVALCGGFLVIERRRSYTTPDPRFATPFDTFQEADEAGKQAVYLMYPPDRRYYAIFHPALAGPVE